MDPEFSVDALGTSLSWMATVWLESAERCSSDVLMLPASYESFGMVVSEAFAYGGPAVVADACAAVGNPDSMV